MGPSLRQSFISLRHRNFRLIWLGLLISYAGSAMQTAALLWHVSLLAPPDGKALALGLVGLVRILPIIVFSLVSGVVADASDRRRLMMLTQFSGAVVSAALAALAFYGVQSLTAVYALAAVASACGAFDLPARQSLVPMLVPREHFPNAVSLNQIALQSASICGPAIGGLMIATVGLGWAYVFDAISFLTVVVALLMMRDVPARENADAEVSLRAAREGLRFVFRAPMIRSTMLLDFFATFFSSAIALLPIFAQDILQVGAEGYGWLYAAPAVGALAASAVMVPLVERINRRGMVLLWAVAVYGLATIVFGISRSFWLTFACLAFTGSADTVSAIIRNIVRQMETPDRLRGRMTGVNMMFFIGGPQLGELEAGLVASWVGAPLSVIIGGVGCLVATATVAATTPMLRQYKKEGPGARPTAA